MIYDGRTASTKHVGYLDGLRALAAMYVVLVHAYNVAIFHDERFGGVAGWFFPFFTYGRYAVNLFIVLSGFCLMMPAVKNNDVLRDGVLNFFKRRAWRIVPPYYFAMLLSLALIHFFINKLTGNIWDASLPVTLKSVFTHIILMHDVFHENLKINYAFWSISVEWRIYFLFPLLLICWRKLGPIKTTILSMPLMYITLCVLTSKFGRTLTVQFVSLFTMGMLAASIVFSSKHPCQLKSAPWGWITLAMSVVVLVVLPIIHIQDVINESLSDYCVGLLSMSLLVTVAMNEGGWLWNVLSYKPLAFIGTFAYSIYLIHAPLLQIFWQYLFAPLQKTPLLMFAALLFIATPAIVGLSYIFYLGCERPFISKGKKRNQPSPSPETVSETVAGRLN